MWKGLWAVSDLHFVTPAVTQVPCFRCLITKMPNLVIFYDILGKLTTYSNPAPLFQLDLMILQSYDSCHRTVVYHKLRPSPRTRRSIDRDQRAAYPRSPTPGKPRQTQITATFQLHCATSSNSAPMRNLSQSSKNLFLSPKEKAIVII